MKKVIHLLFCLFPLFSISQIIPVQARADWSIAGFEGTVPNFAQVLDITTYGAIPNDTLNDYAAVDSAIQSLNGSSGVIYFPAGRYIINNTIVLQDSLILRGAGADSTTLLFNFGGNAANSFHIGNGLTEPFYPISSGYLKGSKLLKVSNANTFLAAGDNLEIREENGTWDIQPVNWAEFAVGHLAQVDSVRGDTLWMNEALRIDFDSTLHPEIRKVTPRTMCGFECFKLVREDENTNGINYGFDFANATNCWIQGVESERSICAHVAIDRSSHISIKGCYFHDAHLYDGTSTRGYGVVILSHATSNLIEDNLFKHLRHSMMAKQGANGNVFAYNYSREPNRSEPIPDYAADLCLHGHFPFSNLFEGNIAQNLQIDMVWGPAGPYNTFFRNKVELYGILMSSGSVQSNNQNFVGNDVSSNQLLQGNYSLTGTGHFQSGNRVQGTVTPANTGSLSDYSYYLDTVRPFFWNLAQTLPTAGIPNAVGADNNPARQRYLDGAGLTRCVVLPYADTTISTYISRILSNAFELKNCVANRNSFTITTTCYEETKADIELLTITGQLLAKERILLGVGTATSIISVTNLAPGIYFVQLTTLGKVTTQKVIYGGN
jgi:hypothetical protein